MQRDKSINYCPYCRNYQNTYGRTIRVTSEHNLALTLMGSIKNSICNDCIAANIRRLCDTLGYDRVDNVNPSSE